MNFKNITKCLMVNTQCDWDCKYCIAETNMFSCKPQKPRPADEVIFIQAIKFLNEVPVDKYHSITLSGGEPGLLPINKLKEIFQLCYNRGLTIDINSNGRIFSKLIEMLRSDLKATNESQINQGTSLKNCVETVVSTIDWHIFPDLKEVVEPLFQEDKPYDITAWNVNFTSKLNIPNYFKLKEWGYIQEGIQSKLSTGDPSAPIEFKLEPKDVSHPLSAMKTIMDGFIIMHKIMVRPLIVVTEQDIPYLRVFLDTIQKSPVQLSVPFEIRICEKNESNTNKDLVVTGISQVKVLQVLNDYLPTGLVSQESLDILNKIFNKEKRNDHENDRIRPGNGESFKIVTLGRN